MVFIEIVFYYFLLNVLVFFVVRLYELFKFCRVLLEFVEWCENVINLCFFFKKNLFYIEVCGYV